MYSGENGPINDDQIRRKYGPAANIARNMLEEIKNRNKDEQLAEMINRCWAVESGQATYIENCTSPESDLQLKIRTDTKTDNRAAVGINMLSGHIEGNFLKMMAEMQQAKSILEIGMYTGYSAVSLAQSAFCEELVTLEIDPYYENFLKSRLVGTELESKIRILVGHARDSLLQLKTEGKQFDFIFIDSNKGGYIKYYKYIMDNNLLKPTGTIACDNILWYGRTFNQADEGGKLLHEFVEFVKSDERVYQMILPIRDGIFMIKPVI